MTAYGHTPNVPAKVYGPIKANRQGRPRATIVGLGERLERYRIAERCAEFTDDALTFWAGIAKNPAVPLKWRFEAYDRLMDRAFGRPTATVEVQAEVRSAAIKKIIHEIRWLPADPKDKSKVIEQEPD